MCLTDMFIRLNFALQLEEETGADHSPTLGPPGQAEPFTSFPYTYYMLITTILKPRLLEVNLVGHYSGLYFRVLCGEALWGFWKGVHENLEEMGALCLTREKKRVEGREYWLYNGEGLKCWHSLFGPMFSNKRRIETQLWSVRHSDIGFHCDKPYNMKNKSSS